jgi:phage tail-like protein
MPITSSSRGYTAGKYGFEMDSLHAGWLHSAEGGHATSDVVQEKLGPDHIIRKHIGGVKYEDITIACGTGMSKGFYQWIKDSFDHKHTRQNGAIIAADYDYKEHSRLTFTHGLITEVGFPALDAASKDAAKMTIKISPEVTRQTVSQGGGQSIAGDKYSIDARVQKQWLPANFRLRIDGLEEPCSRVNKIEAIVVKQKVIENPVGEMRDYEKEPAYLEIPNLVITFPESHAKPFYDWHESFVIRGENGDEKEKGGTLEYLSPDLKTILFTITFKHLGIFKLTPDKVESGNEQIRRLKAEMYCEDLSFDYKSAWA